jgi:hypothetical protein
VVYQLVAGFFSAEFEREGTSGKGCLRYEGAVWNAVALALDMAKSQPRQGILTKLSNEQFEQFILPHLSKGSRGPATTLSFHAIFNYILCALYLGCQWKNLRI